MSWLHNIQKKSPQEKMRVIWIVMGVASVLLIVVWVATSKLRQDLPKDTKIIDTFKKSFKDTGDKIKSEQK